MKTLELIFSLTLLTIVITVILGTIGFVVVEGLSPFDSLYFVLITMSTVGYGDIIPTTVFGQFMVIVIVLIGVFSFLGLAATIIDVLIERREKSLRSHRLSMITGSFFSEVGLKTLNIFISADPNIKVMQKNLMISDNWSKDDFRKAHDSLNLLNYKVDIKNIDLEKLRSFLVRKRPFLLDLLELPLLVERYIFTDLQRALFHIIEELSYRNDFKDLPQSDLNHLSVDITRAYIPLVNQWLIYMEYMKNSYPYLFSFAMRTNPFDPNATVIVK